MKYVGERGGGQQTDKLRGNHTYFRLALLFSASGSLRAQSSEGGVAELDSFFGLTAGMIVKGGLAVII